MTEKVAQKIGVSYDKYIMKKLTTYIVFALVMFPLTTHASVEEELKRLNKCYGLFVRERIPASDPLWKQVASGTKSGTDACMEIFDKAKLDKNGEIAKGPDGKYDYEGMRVLSTLMRFHKSQFEIPDYSTTLANETRFTRDVIDGNEAAYHFVYSIFGEGQKFSDTVTRDHSIRAIRYSEKTARTRTVVGSTALQAFFQGVYKRVKNDKGVAIAVPDDAKSGVSRFTPELVETGLMVGLVRDDVENEMATTHFDALYGTQKFDSKNVNKHMGAGVIGTQAYLLANMGKDAFSNGGSGLFRRWSKHVLSDMLCRDLPALRSKDVISEVIPESKIAFKTGISCMGCHSAMDPLAGTARNIRANFTHNTNGDGGMRVKFVSNRPADMPFAPMPTITAETNFFRRPANGRLYYRSFDGKLVKEEAEGLEELGEVLAKTDDLYVCAAKRYYRLLTGVNVSLSDIGDINTPAFTTGQKYQRDKVINYGIELKQHQSIRTLIKRIIESEAFIYPDHGV